MPFRSTRLFVALMLPVIVLIFTVVDGRADHESSNALVFAPIANDPSPDASGTGTIIFHGGQEPTSRWTVTFQFTGLSAGVDYVVVDQGRFGEDGAPEATAFTPLCSFRSDERGEGGCWDYLLGLRRVSVLQLRENVGGAVPILQATREPGGPGSIVSTRNEFSPSPTATSAGTPSSLPRATPANG